MKQGLVAPKPQSEILIQQIPSSPDDGLSYNSSKSIRFLNDAHLKVPLKVRYDRFGNIIDKKRREQQVSFRDRVTKQQRVYDLFQFDLFQFEKLQVESSQKQKRAVCCVIQ
ncbi:unnamed protein product [Paramecium sonneborni]|uniref:Uncharacterized protein n=1 Tax=Paramecium sonneborni TaxID=65129 RepID=A0A8S1RFF2_9CILI|nr:unnamed protein product [Paramecium sonneborni]